MMMFYYTTKEAVSTDKYAMLDCCKPFVLDTENNELKEWKLNS